MKKNLPRYRILAIDSAYRGFGFAVLEDPNRLLDWGLTDCSRGKTPRRRDPRADCFLRVEELVELYQPNVIVLGGCDKETKRCHDARFFAVRIQRHARRRGIKVRTFSTATIRKAFSSFGGTTKEQIAKVIANQFSELLPLPRHREIHMSEPSRMSIFDAVALALVSLHRREY